MRRFSFLTSIWAVTGILTGQTSSAESISPQEVQNTYNRMQYRTVIEMVQAELEHHPSQSRENLTVYLKYLGLALYNQEGAEAARSVFSSLLLVDPAFRLAESEVSPKIIALLESLRETEGGLESGGKTQDKYIVIEDTGSSELLSAVLFPGRGHLLRDQRRGYVYGTLFVLSAGGALYYTYLTDHHRIRYSQAYVQTAIDHAYDDYNRSYQVRNNLVLAAVLIYGASLMDLVITSR